MRHLEEGVKEFLRLPDPEREAVVNDIRGFWLELAQLDDKVFSAALSGVDTDNQEHAQKLIQAPAFVFVLRVAMPCLLLYKEYPGRLFAKARRGNVRALEQLPTLDKSALFEPRIQEYAHRLAQHHPRTGGHEPTGTQRAILRLCPVWL